jgi:hypothetical protein
MSILVLTLGGSAALWYSSRERQFARYKPDVKKDPWVPGVQQRPELSTGTYGDISTLSNLVHQPGYVVGERHDVDLTGVPCRWLIMRNGAVYRTYDLDTSYVTK